MKKPKISNSRPARWARAVAAAQAAKEALETALADLNEAREELNELKQEYQDWYDNMSENLQNGPTGEKLQAVLEFDFDTEATIEGADWIDEAEGADLPLGWGKD